MDFEQITYEKSDGIATITLNRPERMNAFTPQMLDEWYAALLDSHTDADVRVVILTGAGRGFCAGADLRGGEGVSLLHRERFAGRQPQLPARQRAAHPSAHLDHGEAVHRGGERRSGRRRDGHGVDVRHALRLGCSAVRDDVRARRADPGRRRLLFPAAHRRHGEGAGPDLVGAHLRRERGAGDRATSARSCRRTT